jgi:hypothetical protein
MNLSKMLGPLIAILLLPIAANASNFSHLKTACVSYGLSNASDDLLKEYASRFDFLFGPHTSKIAKLRALNPNLKMIAYDNFTNLPERVGTKWQLLEDYCFKNSVDLEDPFVHFSENTVITIAGAPAENKLGGYRVADYSTNVAGVLLFDGAKYKSKSGGIGRYPTNVSLGNTSSSVLYLGHWQKFFELNFTFSAKGSGWDGTWEYWNGSSWASLSVNDGTLQFSKDGTVKFVPPLNWKWSKINNMCGGYWIRVRTTTAGSIIPVASSIKKESYYVYQGSGGRYLVPGWDSANDRNGDGFLDDREISSLVNSKSTARFKYQARIPTYYWMPERYVNNLGSHHYRAINSNYVELATTTLYNGASYDGIFEDNCAFNDGSTSPAPWRHDKKLGHYTLNSGGHVIEYPGEAPGIQFTRDHLKTDEEAYRKLKSLGKILIGNSSYGDNPHYNFPPVDRITISNGTAGGYFASNIHDGTLREFWMIPKGSISLQGEWSDPIQGLKSQVNYANDLCVSGNKMGFFHVRSSEKTNPPDFPMERERMYSLAYFYLVNDNKNAYFVFTQGDNFSSYWWWKAIEYDIGTPLGGVSVWANGTDSAGQAYYVYSREYSKALILVKPKPKWSSNFYDSNSPVTTHRLNGTYRRLNYDGTLGGPISQISLKNIESAILIKTGTGNP